MPNTKTGERKLQIQQMLASMLKKLKAKKITTAALAGDVAPGISEVTLYR